jgi:hypothetical protein
MLGKLRVKDGTFVWVDDGAKLRVCFLCEGCEDGATTGVLKMVPLKRKRKHREQFFPPP